MEHTGYVFVAGIHPCRTWMSRSFEYVWWNACVHRLDLSLYCHPKEFGWNGVRTNANSRQKSPLLKAQRRTKPATIHHAGQQVQCTTDWAILTPCLYHCTFLFSFRSKMIMFFYELKHNVRNFNRSFFSSMPPKIWLCKHLWVRLKLYSNIFLTCHDEHNVHHCQSSNIFQQLTTTKWHTV